MFITKRHIRRRTFLQGAGAMLALPLLDAMVPAGELLAQTAANPKTRFVGIFFPHGMAPGHWEPAAEGALPEKLPYILESLEKVKDQTTVLTGLWSQSAEPPEGTTGSDHWVAAAYLTGLATHSSLSSSELSPRTFTPEGPFLLEQGTWIVRAGDRVLGSRYHLRWRRVEAGWKVVLLRWGRFR